MYLTYTDSIGIKATDESGFDEYGIPLPHAYQIVDCKIIESEKMITIDTKSGKTAISKYTIYLDPIYDVKTGEKVLIDGDEVTVLTRSYKRDLSGNRVMLKVVI